MRLYTFSQNLIQAREDAQTSARRLANDVGMSCLAMASGLLHIFSYLNHMALLGALDVFMVPVDFLLFAWGVTLLWASTHEYSTENANSKAAFFILMRKAALELEAQGAEMQNQAFLPEPVDRNNPNYRVVAALLSNAIALERGDSDQFPTASEAKERGLGPRTRTNALNVLKKMGKIYTIQTKDGGAFVRDGTIAGLKAEIESGQAAIPPYSPTLTPKTT